MYRVFLVLVEHQEQVVKVEQMVLLAKQEQVVKVEQMEQVVNRVLQVRLVLQV